MKRRKASPVLRAKPEDRVLPVRARTRRRIHWDEPSTLRGAVWVMGCLAALVLLWKGEHEAGMRALATTGMVAGTLGMTTRDTPHDG